MFFTPPSEHFFPSPHARQRRDLIEKRFAREHTVRLVSDSAERHRGQINVVLEEVRPLDGGQRTLADAHLL